MVGNARATTIAACILAAALPLAPATALGELATPQPPEAAVPPVALPFMRGLPAVATPMPADPQQALVASVAQAFALLGLTVDPSAELAAAGLPDEVAGRLALVVASATACAAISQSFAASPAWRDMLASWPPRKGLDLGGLAGLEPCGQDLWVRTLELEAALQAAGMVPPADFDPDASLSASAPAQPAPAPSSPSTMAAPACASSPSANLWPVLRISGTCNDTYHHDYMVQVDTGGNDKYDNAAGGNMMDLRHGPSALLPAGSSPTGFFESAAEATGCQVALNSLIALDCVPLASVLLDTQGKDKYNMFEAPDIDALCTAEQVVRRMVTVGSGFSGVAILRDTSGNDHYNGKTGAIGSGHVGGIGVLSDVEGNDHYTAVRNSQGFSLVAKLGLLRDEAGNDHYTFYMPAPLDPSAPNETPGAGGVIDDTGVCDNVPRFVQGTAQVGGVGILDDVQGNDDYYGGGGLPFISPLQSGGLGGSQGFGQDTGFGLLLDRAGSDGYAGVPDRDDHVTLMPGGTSTNTGMFVDR